MRIVLILTIFFFTVLSPAFAHADSLIGQKDTLQADLDTKRIEIERLEQEIEKYRKDIVQNQGRALTFQSRINVLLQQIKKKNLEIRLIARALDEIKLQIKKTERSLGETVKDIIAQRAFLAEQVRALDEQRIDKTAFFVFFQGGKLSDTLQMVQGILAVQDKTKQAYDTLQALKEKLSGQKETLQEQRDEQVKILALQESQRKEIQVKEREHETLLQEAKQKAKKLTTLVELSKGTIEKLKNEIYALQRIGVTVQVALRLGALVAERTGVRAAFLIAVLEVESRLGLNVGKGTYKNDMNPNQHEAFLALMRELGRDPETTPVSKKPSYGWGGAMGPAQFLPQTWNGYKDEVARLTGHNPPNPWNIEDAFMASGVKLSRNGASAKTVESERRAAKIYISGNPNCTRAICNSYSNMVLDKASDIEDALSKNN
ncbi:MAG: lytic murein transglycosylase [Candidatus Yonathbacteria bacterium]|nr:lytic murein transglycosylase [Candidatus Yonathbacteria bacterium]